MRPFLIGLAGLSGAGKSTLASHLENQGGVKRFRLDNYYKDEADCPKVEGMPHWDLPESLHLDQVEAVLRELLVGGDVLMPVYRKGINRVVGHALFRSAPVIFVEGYMLFAQESIRELLDLRLWLDVSEEMALSRKRLRQPDYNMDYYQRFALPAAREHVLPCRAFAHEILDGALAIGEVAAQADRAIRKHLQA